MANWFTRLFSRRKPEEVDTQPYEEVSDDGMDSASGRSWLPARRKRQNRERQMATLNDGFNELVGMTRSIREHMDQQLETQRTLVDLMKHLPDAVEGLKGVGKATQQQTETLALLKTQLESSVRHDEQIADSMTNFNKTLALMNETSKGTAQTVGDMANRTKDSDELLRHILERSERRLVWMVVMLMVGTLTVLGVGLYIGFSGRDAEESASVEEAVSTQRFEQNKTISELGEQPAIMTEDVEMMVEDDAALGSEYSEEDEAMVAAKAEEGDATLIPEVEEDTFSVMEPMLDELEALEEVITEDSMQEDGAITDDSIQEEQESISEDSLQEESISDDLLQDEDEPVQDQPL